MKVLENLIRTKLGETLANLPAWEVAPAAARILGRPDLQGDPVFTRVVLRALAPHE